MLEARSSFLHLPSLSCRWGSSVLPFVLVPLAGIWCTVCIQELTFIISRHSGHLGPHACRNWVDTVTTSLSCRLWQIYLPTAAFAPTLGPSCLWCWYSVGLGSLILKICLNTCFATLSLPSIQVLQASRASSLNLWIDLFWDRVWLHSPAWPGIGYADQVCLLLPPEWVLELKASITLAGLWGGHPLCFLC